MDLSNLTTLLPAQITFLGILKFIAVLAAVYFVVSLILRWIFGKGSALNKALCAGIGILCIYVLTTVIYTFSPANLERFLVPLPFVKFSGEYLYIMSFAQADFSQICSQALSMVILVLLYNLADSMMPHREDASVIRWFIGRFLTIVAAMLAHYFLTGITAGFLPDLLLSYGPTILLVCLVASLLMGALSVLLGLVLTVVNPIFGLLFTFFFSNKFGKQLSKAMLTALILTALVVFLGHFGYCIISINTQTLLSYIPLLAVLMALWYYIGRML